MLKNYLKITLRNLKRHKIFSFINIFGLSVGLAFSILILLFVRNELSYDSFHKNSDRIYRISLFENYAKDDQHFNSITPGVLGPLLKSYYPEIENCIRISREQGKVKYGSKTFMERYDLADPGFFKMFNFPLLMGNPGDVLSNPNSVVLTKSYAEKYFGNSDAIGKTISIQLNDKYEDFLVTGIAKDVPDNSSIKFNILIPYQKIKAFISERALNSLTIIFCETYVLLKPGATGKEMEAKMSSMIKSLQGDKFKPGAYNLLFQPIKDIHLDTSFPVGLEPISSPVYSYALSIIGFFILFIAGINFVTLSIGKSVSRAGEVGIRKVVGANRKQLIVQYWGESLVLVAISAITGFIIAELLMPLFNSLSGKHLEFVFDPTTILIFLVIILLTGLLSGIYPAFVLSSFNPIQVLKGKLKVGKKSFIRQFLVGGQFALSVILIAGTIAVFDQLEFVRNKDLGFNKENVLVIPTKLNMDDSFKIAQLFKNELSTNKNVMDVSAAATPMGNRWNMIGFSMPDGTYNRFYLNVVDFNYLKTMGLKLISGRDFSKDYPSDYDQAVIVNEAFIKHFGLENDVSGKMPGRFVYNKIIGVVKDFNYESLHSKVKPAAIVLNYKNILNAANDIDTNIEPRLLVRIKAGNIASTISAIKTIWEKLVQGVTFNSTFLKDNIENQYRTEEQLTTIVSLSSILSILITCLGLFGLSILIIIQKTKEIGIRRLLGASAYSVYGMLSKEFLLIILAAQLLGIPVAWYLINKWLTEFAYRINIDAIIFLAAGLITIIIAFVTISIQAIKAANTKPVDTLRYE
jgi:putative ABC transport system permease protein